MKHMKALIALIVVIIVIVAFIVAWQVTLPPAQKQSIKIGLVAPESTSIGQDMDRAANLAVDQINAAGGIYVKDWGYNATITLITADTVDDSPTNAVPPVTNAITDQKVDLLIGGYSSAGTLADEVQAVTNRVPFIITGASSDLVTRRGPQGDYGGDGPNGTNSLSDAVGMSYMFHYCTTTYDYTKTMMEFFATVMKPMVDSNYGFSSSRPFRLAIAYRDDAFGNGVFAASGYWIINESLPITLVANETYPTTTTNFQTYLTAIKAASPDAVLVVDNPDRTPLVVTQGINDVGLQTVYMAVENNEDPAFYSGLGQTGNGQLLESKFSPFAGSYSTAITPYVTAYEQKYPSNTPGMMGADTYDAFYIAKNAIERAGTVDKAAVRDALEATNMTVRLVLTQTCQIQFSTGTNYHEIGPITFMEQLYWNQTAGVLRPKIVWTPSNVPSLVSIRQGTFALPQGYTPGSP